MQIKLYPKSIDNFRQNYSHFFASHLAFLSTIFLALGLLCYRFRSYFFKAKKIDPPVFHKFDELPRDLQELVFSFVDRHLVKQVCKKWKKISDDYFYRGQRQRSERGYFFDVDCENQIYKGRYPHQTKLTDREKIFCLLDAKYDELYDFLQKDTEVYFSKLKGEPYDRFREIQIFLMHYQNILVDELMTYQAVIKESNGSNLTNIIEYSKRHSKDVGVVVRSNEFKFTYLQLQKGLETSIYADTSTKEIVLSDVSLSIIPHRIFQCANLTRLHLEANKITNYPSENEIDDYEREFEECPVLQKLEYFNLAQNKLTQIPSSFGELRQLKWLFLDHNQIKELHPNFCQLTQLVCCVLSYNQLSDLPIGFDNLTNLKILALAHNNLTHISFRVSKLTQLKIFDISYNKITEYPIHLDELAIHYIHLHHNPFTDQIDNDDDVMLSAQTQLQQVWENIVLENLKHDYFVLGSNAESKYQEWLS